MPEQPTMIETYDSAMILDQNENEWRQGWLRVYKRHKTVTFLDAVSVSTSVVYAASFYCAPYSEFALLLNVIVPGALSTLMIDVEVSDDNSNWHELKDDGIKDMQFQNGDGARKVCLSGKCLAQYMRVKALATVGTWTVTVKSIYNS